MTGLIVSCHSTEPPSKDKVRFIALDTIQFINGGEDHEIYTGDARCYSFDGKTIVSFFDYVDNHLILYDLSAPDKAERIDVLSAIGKQPTELNGFMVNGCFVRSPDSIYVLLNPLNEIHLIDHVGRHLKTWKVASKRINTDRDFFLLSFYGDAPLEMLGSSMICLQQLPDPDYGTNEDLRKFKFRQFIDAEIDLSGDTAIISHEFGRWPSMYSDSYYYDVTPCRTFNGQGDLLYSFGVNDTIYTWNAQGLVQRSAAKGRFLTGFDPFDGGKEQNASYVDQYTSEQPRYRRILFDPFRKLIYRVVVHGQDYHGSNGELKLYADKPWSIQVLDESMSLIDEVRFESGRYNFDGMMICPRGLMIELINSISKEKTTNDPTFVLYDVRVSQV